MCALLIRMFAAAQVAVGLSGFVAPGRPASSLPLSVEIVAKARVSDPELEAARDQIERIWRQEGISVQFVGPSDEPAAHRLRIVLADMPVRQASGGSTLCALGSIRFVNGVPESELTVSVNAVRDFVRRARPGQSPGIQLLEGARILGRVAAHEIGHYLLGDTRHQTSGLMRAQFDGAELLGPQLAAFAPPRRAELVAGLLRITAEDTR